MALLFEGGEPRPPVDLGAGMRSLPADAETWRAILDTDPLAMPEHARGWLEALCEGGRFRDESRVYELQDGRRFLLPLVRRTGLPVRGGWLASYPAGWGSGGLVGPGLDAAVVSAVVDDLRALGAAQVAVRPDPLAAAHWAPLAGPGVTVVRRHAHVLDLSDGLDAVERRLHHSVRRGIAKARRSGVTIDADRGGTRLLATHYDLFLRSVHRWAARQHEPTPLALARARRRDPLAGLEARGRHLGKDFVVLVARVDDVPAASLVLLLGRTAHYTRGAMDRDLAAPSRATHLLQWHAIELAAQSGATTYHLGETAPGSSLARYKENFGATGHDYPELRIERVPFTRAGDLARSAVKRIVGFRDAD